MSRLAAVLTQLDLPSAELNAARLDGEVFAIQDCFLPIDEIEAPMHRARTLSVALPGRFIAEQRTAAWIFGAISSLPRPLQLCTDIRARARPTAGGGLVVREVVIDESELVLCGGMRVTNTLRTVLDLARFSVAFGEKERAAVGALASLGGFCFSDCARHIESRRNLPLKHRALQRLESAFAPADQPPETR